MYNVRLSPLKVSLILLTIIICLLVGGMVTQYTRFTYGYETQFGFARLFKLDSENTLPSWYSSVALLISSVTLGIIGLHKKQKAEPWAWHWLALAVLFFCLSADEAASIHEMAAPLLHRWLETTGHVGTVISIIGTAWLLAGMPFVAIVFLMFWRFLRHLPVLTRTLFVVAGIVFISGALGMEAEGGRYLVHNGEIDTLTYQMMVVLEEGLEMLGIVVFLYALMRYMELQSISLIVAVSSGRCSEVPVDNRPETLQTENAA
jgi:hypothetical protein